MRNIVQPSTCKKKKAASDVFLKWWILVLHCTKLFNMKTVENSVCAYFWSFCSHLICGKTEWNKWMSNKENLTKKLPPGRTFRSVLTFVFLKQRQNFIAEFHCSSNIFDIKWLQTKLHQSVLSFLFLWRYSCSKHLEPVSRSPVHFKVLFTYIKCLYNEWPWVVLFCTCQTAMTVFFSCEFRHSEWEKGVHPTV